MENFKDKKKLSESYEACRLITKNSSFYDGMMFTTINKRNAFFAMYAWLRIVDDIADSENFDTPTKIKQLTEFQHITNIVVEDQNFDYCDHLPEKFWLAFKDTVTNYHIPYYCLNEMIKGQEQDLEKYDYKNFSELYEYCYKVASTVGMICIQIWGYKGGEKTIQRSEWFGVAVQLTNILRDFYEDTHMRQRVYLPAEFVGLPELTMQNYPNVPRETLLLGIETLINKAND